MRTIAVIEDDEPIGNLLEEALQGEGYGVLRAYSGTEAQYLLAQHTPDLVLLDLMLPGLTGEEFIAQMRKKKTTTMTWKKISTNNRKNPAPKTSIRSANFSPISVPNARSR